MEQYYHFMGKTPLFRGILPEELHSLLACLAPTYREFPKNEIINRMGENALGIGLVLSGSVHIVEEDFWGNRTILAAMEAGELFGEAYACLPGERLLVSVVTAEKCSVMFLEVEKVLTTCSSACRFHAQLVHNLLVETARKNLMLTRKLSHMAKRSTRAKLLSYLSEQSIAQGSDSFTIPFSRQELADYLGVDRSAMSGELSKMRNDGILTYQRNQFRLLGRLP